MVAARQEGEDTNTLAGPLRLPGVRVYHVGYNESFM